MADGPSQDGSWARPDQAKPNHQEERSNRRQNDYYSQRKSLDFAHRLGWRHGVYRKSAPFLGLM